MARGFPFHVLSRHGWFTVYERQEKYSEYADRLIEEHIKGAVDFSMFEPERPIFDGASGTQIQIHGMGLIRDTLIH